MILARSTRLNQPSATVEIDPTNPLSRGLVGNINPAARNFQSVGDVAFKSTSGGVALLGTGASFAFKDVPPFGNGATLLFVGNWLAGGGAHVAAIGNSGTGDQCFIFQAGASGSSRPRALIRTVSGGGVTTAETLGSGNDTQYPQIEVWCARYDGTTALKVYRNGDDFTGGNAQTAASGSISTLNNISLGGTNRGSDAFASSGQMQVLGLYWNRALSPAEINEISRNPWQIFKPVQRRIYFDMGAVGGGTSTVSSDLLSSYDIRGAVTADSSHDYSVRGAVAAPIGAAYDIRGSVFANLGAGYAVRGSAVASLSASYDVRGSAITDLSAGYTIRGSAGANSDVAYAVRGAVHATASPAYDIRGSVASDLSAAYDILSATSVVADSACAYSIRGTTYATTSPAYDIRGAAVLDQPAAYAVRGSVIADLPTSYDIETGVSSVYADLSASYFIDGSAPSVGLSPADLAAIRAELAPELTAIFQIQTKVDAAL